MQKIEPSQDVIDLVIKRHQEGVSNRKLGKEIGRSSDFVVKILKQNGKYRYKGDDKNQKKEECLDDYDLKCKKTGKIFDRNSIIIKPHIIKEYPDYKIETGFKRRDYEYKTGKKWYDDFFDKVDKPQEKETKQCKYCEWKTVDLDNKSGAYTTHLLKKHNKDTNEYIKEFPEEKWLFKTHFIRIDEENEMLSNEDNFIACAICGEKMTKITRTHLIKHNTTLQEYKNKYGTTLSETSLAKFISIANKANKTIYSKKDRKDSKSEKAFLYKLEELNISHCQQYNIGPYYFDFKLDGIRFPIEIDGCYWHGYDRDENWTISAFNNVINDYKKSDYIKNKLFRIIDYSLDHKNLNQIFSFDSLINFLDKENFDIKKHKIFNLKEDDLIISKNRIEKGVTIENSKKLIYSIQYLINNFYNPCNSVGFVDFTSKDTVNQELKEIFFKNVYKIKNGEQKSLNEFFSNKKFMKNVVSYKLGLNDEQTYFDITLKNLFYGIKTS